MPNPAGLLRRRLWCAPTGRSPANLVMGWCWPGSLLGQDVVVADRISTPNPAATAFRSATVNAVLALVADIPLGRVLSYGDIANILGLTSPRQVGAVMGSHGGQVDWHRVVHSDGRAPAPLRADALDRLRAEGCPMLLDHAGRAVRVDMGRARWVPDDAVSEPAANTVQ